MLLRAGGIKPNFCNKMTKNLKYKEKQVFLLEDCSIQAKITMFQIGNMAGVDHSKYESELLSKLDYLTFGRVFPRSPQTARWPDAFVLDINVPFDDSYNWERSGDSGIRCFKYIRESEKIMGLKKSSPVIFYSSINSKQFADEMKKRGYDEKTDNFRYFEKLTQEEAFVQSLDSILAA